jgi:betaine-aldehyde dehydrogenase
LVDAPLASTSDMDRAVRAARDAFDNGPWPRMSPDERAEIMRRLAAELSTRSSEAAEVLTSEMGSPIAQSRAAQLPIAVQHWNFDAGLGEGVEWEEIRPVYDAANDGMEVRIYREPVGVVAAVIPWNGPQIVAAMKLGPALLAGCTTILKPAPEASVNFAYLGDACRAAGLPPGVVNIVPAGREVGEYLVVHPEVDKVSFTGSTLAGKRIASLCGARIRPCTLELGGKSAAILMPDLDLEAALPALLPTMAFIAGQACNAPTRLLVPQERAKEMTDTLAEAIGELALGDAHDPDTYIGPLVAKRQQDRVNSYIEAGKQEGAVPVVGGGRLDRPGWFVDPTLFADVDMGMKIAKEEIFGPVYCVLTYDGEDEALRIANDTDYGLAGSVWTADVEGGLNLARKLQAGSLGVNNHTLDSAAPFGGIKESGMGRERGQEGMDPYLVVKTMIAPKL